MQKLRSPLRRTQNSQALCLGTAYAEIKIPSVKNQELSNPRRQKVPSLLPKLAMGQRVCKNQGLLCWEPRSIQGFFFYLSLEWVRVANLVSVIKYLYDKATSADLFNGSIGNWFRTTVWVRQGCLLSLTLFSIVGAILPFHFLPSQFIQLHFLQYSSNINDECY